MPLLLSFGATVVDPALTLGLTAVFPFWRWMLHSYVFQPLCWKLLGYSRKASRSVSCSQTRLTVDKACESCWKLVVYSAFLVLEYAALRGQPWVTDTSQLWDGWPVHSFGPAMSLLYNAQLSFYISSVFMILLWEIRRRDFAAMFTHHLVTVVLIAASMHLRFWRVGCLVMALHDVNDVLMEAAKLCKYFGQEGASTSVFVGFIISWAITRLGLFPFVVVRSTLFDSSALVGEQYTPASYYMFNTLLCVLCCLHCYWFTLIVRIAWDSIRTGKTDDVREKDDD